jgi:hypothetical protein
MIWSIKLILSATGKSVPLVPDDRKVTLNSEPGRLFG